ncbi:MAG: hypothetical protein VYB54_15675 [Pseudomonadota bacterium]|nr:hypothetical protein [Pseudomonadota bacterium]
MASSRPPLWWFDPRDYSLDPTFWQDFAARYADRGTRDHYDLFECLAAAHARAEAVADSHTNSREITEAHRKLVSIGEAGRLLIEALMPPEQFPPAQPGPVANRGAKARSEPPLDKYLPTRRMDPHIPGVHHDQIAPLIRSAIKRAAVSEPFGDRGSPIALEDALRSIVALQHWIAVAATTTRPPSAKQRAELTRKQGTAFLDELEKNTRDLTWLHRRDDLDQKIRRGIMDTARARFLREAEMVGIEMKLIGADLASDKKRHARISDSALGKLLRRSASDS